MTMTHASITAPVITASVPLLEPPGWALAERQLFDLLDHAWRRFARDFTGPDGRLTYRYALTSRDGADDFYEAFFNWPQLYLLGGADDLLAQSELHWEGVTAQLTELGMLSGEYERGYDWFHQGESLLLLYFLCMAAPDRWAVLLAVNVSVELPLPGAAMERARGASADLVGDQPQLRRRSVLHRADYETAEVFIGALRAR